MVATETVDSKKEHEDGKQLRCYLQLPPAEEWDDHCNEAAGGDGKDDLVDVDGGVAFECEAGIYTRIYSSCGFVISFGGAVAFNLTG